VSGAWILKLGETVPGVRRRRGDFEDWIRAAAPPDTDLQIADPRLGPLPDPIEVRAAVLTGSAAMLDEPLPWREAVLDWVRALLDRESWILGICFGHQVLGLAAGGHVGWNPKGREIGRVLVGLRSEAREDLLFRGLPDPLPVLETHSQSLRVLPPGARLLAGNDHDPHQAFRLGERAWGVQFHPEFDADVVRGYLAERGDELRAEGLDPAALAAGLRDTPGARRILERFLRASGS